MFKAQPRTRPLAPAPAPVVPCLDPATQAADARPMVALSAGVAAATGSGGGCGSVAARLRLFIQPHQWLKGQAQPRNRICTIPHAGARTGARSHAHARASGCVVALTYQDIDYKEKSSATDPQPGRNRDGTRLRMPRNHLRTINYRSFQA